MSTAAPVLTLTEAHTATSVAREKVSLSTHCQAVRRRQAMHVAAQLGVLRRTFAWATAVAACALLKHGFHCHCAK